MVLMKPGVPVLLAGLLGLAPLVASAQGVVPRAQAGWGTNMLFSPGTDLESSPGRTGYAGLGLTLGGKDARVVFQPAVSITGSAYRTRMAYRVHFVTQRTTMELDLVLGFRQMSGTVLQAGLFAGTVTKATALIEQGARETFVQGYQDPRLRNEHFPNARQAGIVLGLVVPITNDHRLGLDIRIRQHLVPLVERDQSFALVFNPEQLVIATNTKPTVLTVGFGYSFGKGKADKDGAAP